MVEREVKRICVLGHFTLDRSILEGVMQYLPGGTAFYTSMALNSLTPSFSLITSFGSGDTQFFERVLSSIENVEVLPNKATHEFENSYDSSGDHRIQYVHRKADPFNTLQMKAPSRNLCHLGPLLKNDFSRELMFQLARENIISLDVQGFLRHLDGHQVVLKTWPEMVEILPIVNILKMNEQEFEWLMHSHTEREGLENLLQMGVREIVLTKGSHGSLIMTPDDAVSVPAFRCSAVVDPTGCGDTYMAGYLYMRFIKGKTIEEAGLFASAMASMKLEHRGPFSGSEEEVLSRMKSG